MTEPIDDSAPSTPLLSSSRPLGRAYDSVLLHPSRVCFAGEVDEGHVVVSGHRQGAGRPAS